MNNGTITIVFFLVSFEKSREGNSVYGVGSPWAPLALIKSLVCVYVCVSVLVSVCV